MILAWIIGGLIAASAAAFAVTAFTGHPPTPIQSPAALTFLTDGISVRRRGYPWAFCLPVRLPAGVLGERVDVPGLVHAGQHTRVHAGQHAREHPGVHAREHPRVHPGQYPGEHPRVHPGQYPGEHPRVHPGDHSPVHAGIRFYVAGSRAGAAAGSGGSTRDVRTWRRLAGD